MTIFRSSSDSAPPSRYKSYRKKAQSTKRYTLKRPLLKGSSTSSHGSYSEGGSKGSSCGCGSSLLGALQGSACGGSGIDLAMLAAAALTFAVLYNAATAAAAAAAAGGGRKARKRSQSPELNHEKMVDSSTRVQDSLWQGRLHVKSIVI